MGITMNKVAPLPSKSIGKTTDIVRGEDFLLLQTCKYEVNKSFVWQILILTKNTLRKKEKYIFKYT